MKKVNKCGKHLQTHFEHFVCHSCRSIFTSGERQKLALINKSGSYFFASFPQVAPYETKTVSVRNQNQAACPKGSKCSRNPLSATTEKLLRQETKIDFKGHSTLWGMIAPFLSPAHIWAFTDARQKSGKRWGDKHPRSGSLSRKRRTPQKGLGLPHCRSCNQSGSLEVPASLGNPTHPTAHGFLAPGDTYHRNSDLQFPQTCPAMGRLHKSHYCKSHLTLLYSWHGLGPRGPPEWSTCLHSLKGYCEPRQSTTKTN